MISPAIAPALWSGADTGVRRLSAFRCCARLGDDLWVGDAAGARPAGDVPSGVAGAGLVGAFEEVEYGRPWFGQRAGVVVAQQCDVAAVAFDPASRLPPVVAPGAC